MSSEIPKHIRAVCDSETYEVNERTLIICLDGTGDQFDSDNSNIVNLVSCLKKDDPSQVMYYQSGIGTYDGGGLSNGLNAALDMAVGSGLGVHIKDAYMFLMQAYHEGDKICLFGFSRGAYTARCLAGMIHKVGLLPAHNVSQVQFAYQFYKDDSAAGWQSSHDFKKTFCIDVNVHFIGVFDSVASVGFIPRTLPLSATPTNKPIYFRHAMGLDERRAKFNLLRFQYRESTHSGWKLASEHDVRARDIAALHNQPRGQPARELNANDLEANGDTLPNGNKDVCAAPVVAETDSLEVWFAGCHADVGGGAVKNEVRHKLSRIPLRWMIRQCFECDTGIIFNTSRLAEEGMDVHTLWPQYRRLGRPTRDPPKHLRERYEAEEIGSELRRATAPEDQDLSTNDVDGRDGGGFKLKICKDDEHEQLSEDEEEWVPEQVEDYFDAISPLNDQLVHAKGWWVLEYWPVKVRVQPPDSDVWVKKVGLNLGRYRAVQETSPYLHWTVPRRIEELDYQVKARVDRNATWRITV